MTEQDLFQKKECSAEEQLAWRVKGLYLHTMQNNPDFIQEPYLDMGWFRRHFATAAHEQHLFHGAGPEERARYNYYFGAVQRRVSAAIRRLRENEAKRRLMKVPTALAEAAPINKAPLPETSDTPRDPEQFWLPGFDPRIAASRAMLRMLQDELAARPTIRG